ncbi:conjugative transposon protein TraJ [Mucilaginibacter boryungensis]|uniref:Conjugative transposon protein TraJ n=1 Tax=Mucilaginibacter boryungensis TaxID=768480 RepID=A0ABR9XM36_9SPHI|nr:conjugative transposon protein TraJ [Mucilaginibacter boryungensis]MBE9668154.1 conjugative transposon protein TraJ [Mucilaginibacter boryungensis]
MKSIQIKAVLIAVSATLLPAFSFAQGVGSDIHSLQGVLDNLYNQMIPLCSRMIDVGRGIAGFAALWFIAARVWRHIAAAEAIDFYPLLRPFAIGICILLFPAVLQLLNGVLQPTVTATQAMVGDANKAIYNMLDADMQKKAEQAEQPVDMNSDPAKWYQYTHPDNPAGPAAYTPNPVAESSGWGFKDMVKKWMAEFLNVCFEAAALCIDTIRTFKLIVLAILGPLCFGLSVFDGFQHTLKQWLARYVNVFMWLPVANIFGAIISKIQENMIQLELSGGAADPFFKSTNTAYLIFMLIGIVGYFTVPSIANYIINVGGHALLNKTSTLASSAIAFSTGRVTQGLSDLQRIVSNNNGQSNIGAANNTAGSTAGNQHMQDKLSGKS